MSLGFGIVGSGMIARIHAQAIQAQEHGRLLACCDVRQDAAETFAREFGCRAYGSMEEFVRHADMEVVNICTPSGSHMEPAMAAAEAEKHLIIEKPLEITLERCDRIIDACERKGVLCSGIFQSRFSEVSRAIKKAVESGRLGRLILGDSYNKYFRTQEYYDKGGWHGTWKYDGGGALMNQSIHAIDLLLWLMGPVASVQALMATLGHERIEVEDTAIANVEFQNGAVGVIEGSTCVYPGFYKRIEIAGNRGSLVLVQDRLESWNMMDETEEDTAIREKFAGAVKTGGGAADPANVSFEGHRKQIRDVIDAVQNRRTPFVDAVEARKAVALILAIYESAKTGKRIELS